MVVRTPGGADNEVEEKGILRLRGCFAFAKHPLRSE
jgi:hypothetical protein